MSALYIVTDYAQLNESLAPYDVVIFNCAIDRGRALETTKQKCHRLLSYNMTMLSDEGHGNPTMDAMRTALLPFCLRDKHGELVRSQEYGDFYWDFANTQGAIEYARFVASNKMMPNFGGYFDDCEDVLPDHKKDDLPDPSISKWYPNFRDDFFLELRRLVGNQVVLVANVGPTVPESCARQLSGIAIEEYWSKNPITTLGKFINTMRYAKRPLVNLSFSGFTIPFAGVHAVQRNESGQ